MLCDRCKKNEANVHVSRNINGTVYEQNLCGECAGIPEDLFSIFTGRSGFGGMRGFDGLDRLMDDLKDMREMSVIHAAPTRKAGVMDESDFEAMGLRLPGMPKKQAAPSAPGDDLPMLRKQLDAAVAAQEFEKAAELRDKIYFLEKEKQEKEGE